MKERLILKFELNRKQMINSNDRPHFHQKAKITKFLRQLAEYEGKNVLRDYFGLPYTRTSLARLRFGYILRQIGSMTHRTGHQQAKLCLMA